MYQSFLGLAALSLLPLLHGVYLWKQNGYQWAELTSFRKMSLVLECGGYLLALAGGVIFWAIRFEVAAVHAMGLVMLLGAMKINGDIRRINP